MWYVQLTKNLPDGTYVNDTKRSALWTSRESLLAEYTRRLGAIERVSDGPKPDSVLYRYFDDEEEHAWRYFYIHRYDEEYDS